jgi:hypothetical protein
VNLTREMPLAPLRHTDEFDPGVVGYVALHDLIGPIRRAVADDNPFERSDSLRHHGFQSQLNKLSFVASRRDESICRKCGHR